MAHPHLSLWLCGAELKWTSSQVAAPACSGLAARQPPSQTLEAEEKEQLLQVPEENGYQPRIFLQKGEQPTRAWVPNFRQVCQHGSGPSSVSQKEGLVR